MKVLHLINRIYPEFNGGTEIHTYELCNELSKKGNKQIVLTLSVKQNSKSLSERRSFDKGVVTYQLILPPQINKKQVLLVLFQKQLRLIQLFIKVLLKEKPEVVHIHNLNGMNPILPLICLIFKTPMVMDFNDYWYLCPNVTLSCDGDFRRCATDCVWQRPESIFEVLISKTKILWLKSSYGHLKVFVHRIVWNFILNHLGILLLPNSQRTKEQYQKCGIRSDLMVIKPSGIFKPGKYLKSKSRYFRIAYLGAIIPSKGVKVLIQAFKKVKDPMLRLTLYGQNGFPPEFLEKMISTDKRIQVASPFDHNQIYQILSNVDLLVIPSIWEETFSLVVQEGLASRTPIIASSIGAMPERIIDGFNGFLFRPGSITQLSKKMEYLVSKKSFLKSKLDFTVGEYLLKSEVIHMQQIYDSHRKHLHPTGRIFSKKVLKWVAN